MKMSKPRQQRTRRASRLTAAFALLLAGSFASGCSNKSGQQTQQPNQVAATPYASGYYTGYSDQYAEPGRAPQGGQGQLVTAEPGEFQGVYVDAQGYAEPTSDNPNLVGYDTLNSGERVQVVEYIHTYPDPIETYPQVWWSGRYYYNVKQGHTLAKEQRVG